MINLSHAELMQKVPASSIQNDSVLHLWHWISWNLNLKLNAGCAFQDHLYLLETKDHYILRHMWRQHNIRRMFKIRAVHLKWLIVGQDGCHILLQWNNYYIQFQYWSPYFFLSQNHLFSLRNFLNIVIVKSIYGIFTSSWVCSNKCREQEHQ